ncbi:NUDIX-domain-containing protein [Lactarius akahatsu]|uniref:NUDIX-domain-containing protein n=1 Tax=Lactarius akahatsu TaxID=416441 RepID=A0AAD4LPP2_9AGAM|nr:NUDIX-domain-containing protein [Lactarius akahatsu]
MSASLPPGLTRDPQLEYIETSTRAPRYNGFGGKVEAGESAAQAAARELKEECGIEASLEHCGTLLFFTKGGPEWAFQIEIYRADAYSGILIETEEMRPEWFCATDRESETGLTSDGTLPPIPYDSMWPDDVHWMPLLLSKRPFVGRVDFDCDNSGTYKLLRWWFGVPSTQS